jgi:TPR repeat protein
MKQLAIPRSFLAVFAALAALVAASPLSAQTPQPGKGIIRKITGGATWSTGGDTWKPLKVGDELRSGAVIKTEAESSVDVFLDVNGPAMRVTPESTVALDTVDFTAVGDAVAIHTKLRLDRGRILLSVRELGPESKFEIQTPKGVASVRGGYDYSISLKRDANLPAEPPPPAPPADKKEAFAFYTKNAKLGDPESQFHLAEIYELGRGVKSDYSKSFKWLKESAVQGYAPAQTSLGMAYELGEGVDRDYVEAYKWMQIAANLGDTNAVVGMSDLTIAMEKNQIEEAKKRAATFVAKPVKRG